MHRGVLHLQRKHISANYEQVAGADTVISILDRAGAKIFAIRTPTEAEPQSLQAEMVSWPAPSLVVLRGTPLGMCDAATFWSSEMPRFAMRDGKPSPMPRDQWRVPMCSRHCPTSLAMDRHSTTGAAMTRVE
jgi:hypothetical protein